MGRAISTFLLGLFFVATAAGAEPRLGRADSFTIATFNINWGNVDLAETVAAIRRAKADVVALQEINTESERHLREALRREYPHIAIRAGEGATGFGFLSKHPLVQTTYLEPQFGFLGTYFATVAIGNRRLQLVNVHLQPDVPRPGDGVLALLKRFRNLEKTHLKEMRRVAERFAKDMPVVVLGDFNSLSAGTAPTFLKERGFADSAAQAHGEGKAPLTWHWRFNGVDLRYRLDYIFLSKEMRTGESRVVKTTSSDHLLVVSRVEWPLAKRKEQLGGARRSEKKQ